MESNSTYQESQNDLDDFYRTNKDYFLFKSKATLLTKRAKTAATISEIKPKFLLFGLSQTSLTKGSNMTPTIAKADQRLISI
jgi:hypothetical protein